ncbi:hypothetical protein DdX_21569 [Ditylenchus destructor]|uniref:Uncharacterized protein n=1 Tax=Ditylenchus destructor TaxID=166010 RepID=A0AAD4QVK8_9BILA|nr:hypothetical protein DdX_21569 [Ditylenchus destructor]
MSNKKSGQIFGPKKAVKNSGVGIDFEVTDFIDRYVNGNCFEKEEVLAVFHCEDTIKQRHPNSELSLGGSTSITVVRAKVSERETAVAFDVGRVESGPDGLGMHASATGVSGKVTMGPIDVGATVGQLTGGAKLVDEHGLDAKIEASASVVKANVGPLTMDVGVGIDTGVKIGDDGVGLKILGTGLQIGKRTEISFFGSKIGFNF